MEWTEKRVATLTKLWNAGHSAGEIAKCFGDVTRNAVIGKAHRLGLCGRLSPIKPAREPQALVVFAERPCQWPFGDPGEPGFHFCAKEAVAEKPYCAEHVARAYHRVDDKIASDGKDRAA